MKYRLQDILICFILVNFSILYATADYTDSTDPTTNIWDAVWYVTEAVIYSLMAVTLYYFNTDKRYRLCWKTMGTFLILRTIWELIAVVNGVSVNQKLAMLILFIINFITIFIIAFLPQLIKWLKRQ